MRRALPSARARAPWASSSSCSAHYGYNIGIVGASLDVISDEFPQTERVLLSLLSSATLVGAIVGSPLSGLCADRFGRRLCTIIGESLSVLGSLGCLVGESLSALVACRLVVGVGVGFCTLAKPIYVAETVPTRSASVGARQSPSPSALGIMVLARGALDSRGRAVALALRRARARRTPARCSSSPSA